MKRVPISNVDNTGKLYTAVLSSNYSSELALIGCGVLRMRPGLQQSATYDISPDAAVLLVLGVYRLPRKQL